MRRSFLVLALLAPLLGGCFLFHGGPSEEAVDTECLADLDRQDIAYTSVPNPEASNPACHVNTAVRVETIEARLSHPVLMSCALASRLDRFEREAVAPLAERDLRRHVVGITHLGAYSCRGNTGRSGELSQHAYGRAIDISGFRFSDGTTARVQRDWHGSGPTTTFLHDVARNACRYFSVVLTPDSNRAHYNHVHLDIGPGKVCSVGG
ncbi:MAG TPA: extensin family protein [Stellaceae bacterium]|jgi:hypothetical protein